MAQIPYNLFDTVSVTDTGFIYLVIIHLIMIEIKNVELIKLQDFEFGDVKATKEEMSELTSGDITPIPIFLMVGKVRYRIGDINRAYVGAHAITGDLYIQLKGHLEMGVTKGNIRPEAYVFEIEKA